ncbi:MAG: hypothetical protein Fur005_07780 [Roseiflexaceae bacterium]
MSELAPDLLIDTAQRAIERGQIARAEALLRLLASQHPTDPRVQALLASLLPASPEAADPPLPSEQPTVALELPAIADPNSGYGAAVAMHPLIAEPTTPRRIRWPLVVVGVALLILLLLVLLQQPGFFQSASEQRPPVPPMVSPVPQATLAPDQPAIPAEPTAIAEPTIAAVTATIVLPTLVPTALPPTQPPRPALSVGSVVELPGWNMTLLRPEDALLLDGSIGGVQPQGRFALVLLAVANTSDTAAALPLDLIALVDDQGRRYPVQASASATYLVTYGRGQVGDLSVNEPVPAGAGILSIPLIFDLPGNARGLQLVIGDGGSGWPVPVR